jgi:MFS family permease
MSTRSDNTGPVEGKSWLSRNVLTLGFVSFFTDVHSETILALLPQFMANILNLPKEMIGLIEGAADATSSGLQIVSGYLSDRFAARKPLIVAGYTLSTITKPFLAFAHLGATVLGVRVADRVGKGLRTAARDALLADTVRQEDRGKAYGLHRAMDTSGAIVGTILALVLIHVIRTGNEEHKFRAAFLYATVAGVVAVLVAFFGIVERRAASPEGHERGVWGLSAQFKVFITAHSIFSFGNFTYAFFLLRAQDVGVPSAWVPGVYLYYNVIYAGLSIPAGALHDRFGGRGVLASGYVLHGLACLGLAYWQSPVAPWICFIPFAAQMAVTGSAAKAVAAQNLRPNQRATGMGVYNGAMSLCALPSSFVAGLLWDKVSPGAPFLLAVGTSTLGALILRVFLRGGRQEDVG